MIARKLDARLRDHLAIKGNNFFSSSGGGDGQAFQRPGLLSLHHSCPNDLTSDCLDSPQSAHHPRPKRGSRPYGVPQLDLPSSRQRCTRYEAEPCHCLRTSPVTEILAAADISFSPLFQGTRGRQVAKAKLRPRLQGLFLGKKRFEPVSPGRRRHRHRTNKVRPLCVYWGRAFSH
jgi:hypothetical protein